MIALWEHLLYFFFPLSDCYNLFSPFCFFSSLPVCYIIYLHFSGSLSNCYSLDAFATVRNTVCLVNAAAHWREMQKVHWFCARLFCYSIAVFSLTVEKSFSPPFSHTISPSPIRNRTKKTETERFFCRQATGHYVCMLFRSKFLDFSRHFRSVFSRGSLRPEPFHRPALGEFETWKINTR